MVIFLLNIAFTLGLIALAAGVGLSIYGQYSQGVGVSLARIFGVFIAILSIISLLITTYVGMNFYNTVSNIGMMQQRMGRGMGPGMMNPGMNPQPGMIPPGMQGQPQGPMPKGNGKGNAVQPMGPIPANEQEMHRQDRPGPPEKVMSPQSYLRNHERQRFLSKRIEKDSPTVKMEQQNTESKVTD